MMDNKMIVEGSLQGVEGGFSFLGRLPYYRGLGLSMIEDIQVSVEGEALPREAIRFAVRGKTYTLDEMETCYDNRWNFGEKATIIALNGGLSAGEHAIGFAVRYRVSYLPFVPTTKDTKNLALAA
ncbi:C-glycoside deglycosidase beta subunit domain-containing protein [Novosphingobium cyanobacteriorum]|uniref:C-deglycosylation enzyme beta subunit n=1 Tax=Novosphingobium cyanobacteriorum TaxID=3024215 RepID=A0ABT6CKJ7_9SPHN|nr:DUF6379 domain-containing protein [Novosphingobium cyanobacteriorum]MDF8333783.1 DUF6379 domain-containing protein [Novosphingobium cyanobacteriorum]